MLSGETLLLPKDGLQAACAVMARSSGVEISRHSPSNDRVNECGRLVDKLEYA